MSVSPENRNITHRHIRRAAPGMVAAGVIAGIGGGVAAGPGGAFISGVVASGIYSIVGPELERRLEKPKPSPVNSPV